MAAPKGSQPRLAALGSPFQGKGLAWTLPPSNGRRCPEGAEVGGGKRYEKERGRSFQVRRLREHPIHRCAVPLPQWGRLRNEDTAFPILSFRAKARNLFRSRSGKGCEDSGEREAPCFQRIGRTVFHADSITEENGNGKRKRSLGFARDDETSKRFFPFLFNLLPSGRSLLPMEGGAPKGRRGMAVSKRARKIVSSAPFAKAPYPPLARSPFPNGEGYDTRIPLSPKHSLS